MIKKLQACKINAFHDVQCNVMGVSGVNFSYFPHFKAGNETVPVVMMTLL